MNLSLLCVSMMNNYISPVLTSYGSLNIRKGYFRQFFQSFVFGSKNTMIEHSRFSQFLQSSVIIGETTTVIYTNIKITVSESNFIDITTGSDGGAIRFTNCDASVKYCSFINCYSSLKGGGFSHTGSNLEMRGTVFVKCRVGSNSNQAGRCFFSKSTTRTIDCSVFSESSFSTSGGDSTFSVVDGLLSFKNLNISYCSGSMGAVGGEMVNIEPNSDYSYTIIVGGVDYCVLYTYLKPMNYSHMIITKSTPSVAMFLPEPGQYIKIFDSLIWDCLKKISNDRVYFVNVQSDYAYASSIILVSSYPDTTIDLRKCGFSNNVITSGHARHAPSLLIFSIFLII